MPALRAGEGLHEEVWSLPNMFQGACLGGRTFGCQESFLVVSEIKMTDPISDLIAQVRNAYLAKNQEVVTSYSRFKEEVAKILKSEGFLSEVKKFKGRGEEKFYLSLKLSYGQEGAPTLTQIRRISKPGQRVYTKSKDLKSPSLGTKIISTPRGLLSFAEAKKRRLGGEEILEVW